MLDEIPRRYIFAEIGGSLCGLIEMLRQVNSGEVGSPERVVNAVGCGAAIGYVVGAGVDASARVYDIGSRIYERWSIRRLDKN